MTKPWLIPMPPSEAPFPPLLFGLFFIGMWLFISTLLGAVSGWFSLMRRFPQQADAELLRLSGLSGQMGAVRLNGILRLTAGEKGLRVGMWRLFGPFSRDFLVPWAQLGVRRKNSWGMPMVELELGQPAAGRLTITAQLGNRLALAAGSRWPERYVPAPPSSGQMAMSLFRLWLLLGGGAALAITLMLRWTLPAGQHPPLFLTLWFPLAAVGISCLVYYLRNRRP